MKILSFVNISNGDDLQCDSGFIFQKLIGPALVKAGCHFCLAGPESVTIDGIHNIHLDFGSNKFKVRFNFEWDQIERIILDCKPDVVWINQPELSANFRAIITTNNLSSTLLTYVHYLPIYEVNNGTITIDPSLNNANLAFPILLSLLSSIGISDYVFIQSKFAKQSLESALVKYNIKYNPEKIFVVPPPYDPFLFEPKEEELVTDKNILYNHRLYAHYGTDHLIKLIGSISHKNGVHFTITDLFGSRNTTRKRLDESVDNFMKILSEFPQVNFVSGTCNRHYYKTIIKKSRISLAPFRKMAVWSMSAIDCLGCGVPVIAPNMGSYPEFIPPSLLYDSFDQCNSIMHDLLQSDSFCQQVRCQGKERIKELSPDKTASRILDILGK
jgi:glycosyltransferase involved in cell wall biosynthesis